MFRKWRLSLLAAVLVAALVVPVPSRAASGLLQTLETIVNLVQAYYKDPVDRDRLLRGAIRGALEELGDPYTAYLDPKEYEEFVGSIEGEFTGIGIFVDQDGKYITVVAPIKGTPADQAGLQAGDRILEVDGTSLVGEPLEKAVRLIRGPAGTQVRLKVERPSDGRVFEVTLTRAVVQVPVLESELLPGQIGYIKLYSFSSDAPDRFGRAWAELKQQGARALVLDLRDNPGGYLDAAVRLAGYFVPPGQPVVQTLRRGGVKDQEVARGTPIGVPLVVLVNKGSASAAEILAGAIQDYGVGKLVGTTTFGKGTVQELLPLEAGGVLKVTIAEYRTPKGRAVHQQGLTPDVVVEAVPVSPERTREMKVDQALTWGNVGLEVLALQQRLNDLGYPAGPENGYFGGALVEAVRKFQMDNGLPATGVADKPTLTRLNEKVAQHVAALRRQDVQKDRALALARDMLAGR